MSLLGQFAYRAVSPLAPVTYLVGGLWTFGADYAWLADKIGDVWAFLAVFLLPIVLVVAPFAAGFTDGDWSLLQLTAGVIVLSMAASAASTTLASRIAP